MTKRALSYLVLGEMLPVSPSWCSPIVSISKRTRQGVDNCVRPYSGVSGFLSDVYAVGRDCFPV